MGQLALNGNDRVWRRLRRGFLSAGWVDVRLEALEPRFVLSSAINTTASAVDPLLPIDPPIVVDGGDTGTIDTGTGDTGNVDDTGTVDDSGNTDDSGSTDDSGATDDGSTDSTDDTSDTPSSIQITDDSEPIIAHRDGTFSETLANFNGTLSLDQYTATIDWGDGNTSAGVITQDDSGAFHVSGSHEYTDAGEYYAGVEIDGSDGSMAWGGATLIAHADPTIVTNPVDIYSNTSTDATSQYLGSFFDINPGSESGYTVTVDWGDGSTSNGSAQQSWDGGFDLYADHAYSTAGSYNVSVTVTRSDGTSINSSGTAQVDDYVPIVYPGPIGGGIYPGGIFEMRGDAMAPGAGAADSSGSLVDATVGRVSKTPSVAVKQSVVPTAVKSKTQQPAPAPAAASQPTAPQASTSRLSDTILSTFDKDSLFGEPEASLLA